MKGKLQIGIYVIVLLLAVAGCFKAQQLWQEREELCGAREALQQELSSAQRFALEHKDYTGYHKRLEKQKETLERELAKRSSSAGCLKLVQRLAAEQGVQLLSVQAQEAAQGGVTQLRLTSAGDFFSSLRWLRRLEREGLAITSFSVQRSETAAQNLQIELLIKLHNVNL